MDKKDDGKRIIFHRLFGGSEENQNSNLRYNTWANHKHQSRRLWQISATRKCAEPNKEENQNSNAPSMQFYLKNTVARYANSRAN